MCGLWLRIRYPNGFIHMECDGIKIADTQYMLDGPLHTIFQQCW